MYPSTVSPTLMDLQAVIIIYYIEFPRSVHTADAEYSTIDLGLFKNLMILLKQDLHILTVTLADSSSNTSKPADLPSNDGISELQPSVSQTNLVFIDLKQVPQDVSVTFIELISEQPESQEVLYWI